MKRTGKSGWLRRASALLLLLTLALSGCAAPAEKTQAEKTAAYLMDTVTEPSCGSVGGEWAVIGLARAGCAVPRLENAGRRDVLSGLHGHDPPHAVA